MSPRTVVTFDLFSALLDSRCGGSAAFARLGAVNSWTATGEQVYDVWDPRNKTAQGDCESWVPWREPATRALTETYAELGLGGDATAGIEALVDSMPQWPLWPDVAVGMPEVATGHRIGLLSNVDDEIFLRTAAADLVDLDVALTSQRLQVYKPHPALYLRALEKVGSMVHVATSARDVRGALESGIPVVRLRRPGHVLDPAGPRPAYEVDTVDDLPAALAALG